MDYTELKKLMSEQKVEMTAAERIKAYNEGKEVDHIPYTLQAPDPAMADIFGFTTSQFAKDFEVKSVNRTKPVRKFVPVFIKLRHRDISIFLYNELFIEISNV